MGNLWSPWDSFFVREFSKVVPHYLLLSSQCPTANPQSFAHLLIRLNTSQLATTLFAAFIHQQYMNWCHHEITLPKLQMVEQTTIITGSRRCSIPSLPHVFSTSYARSYMMDDLKPQAPRFVNICQAAFVFTRTFGLQMPHNNINIPSEQRMWEASKSPGTKLSWS